MRFLFDKETETCVEQIHDAILSKHAIDAQVEHGADKEKALLKSNELFQRITSGVYTEVPERMEAFMRFSLRWRLFAAGHGQRKSFPSGSGALSFKHGTGMRDNDPRMSM